jgi:hypothetical protein
MRAIYIGELAQEAVLASWPASVIGVTSGGIFIITERKRVLFLTYSPFRSPSTVNLEPGLVDLRQNENGAKVLLNKERIILPDSGLLIELNYAEQWKPLEPETLSPAQRAGISGRLEHAVMLAGDQKGAEGLAPILRWLIAKGQPELSGDLNPKILAGLTDLRIAIKETDFDGLLKAVSILAGHGRGLTPATDDCIAGVLLVLNRWGNVFTQKFDLARLNAGILETVRARTTSLSATIIEAATLGQGDERILRVLDGVMSGDYDETTAIQNLVRMGHSSGVDTLVGITLVLTA